MKAPVPYRSKPITVVLILLLSSMVACIDPFDFPFTDEGGTMVVEGILTNGEGPFTVRLSTSRSFNAQSGSSRPAVQGAVVIITDDQGTEVLLQEVRPGLYQTDPLGLSGVPGRIYTLLITTEEGRNYASIPQQMPLPVAIERLRVEQDVELQEVNSGRLEQVAGIRAYIEAQDPARQDNYYIWNWRGTYEARTHPELATPIPKNCCGVCWLTESSQEINVFEDSFADGSNIADRELGFIEINSRKLTNKYLLQAEQLTITKEGFEFWSGVRDQLGNVGSIFDPAPAILRGNVVNPADPNEQVLGFFTVAAKTEAQFELLGGAYQLDAPTLLPVNDDCRLLDNASANRPDYY